MPLDVPIRLDASHSPPGDERGGASGSEALGRKSEHPPRLDGAPWLVLPATQHVLAALAAGGFEGRIVGGTVRNALIGKPVTDVDIATNAPPDEVMRLAAAAGLATVPTGLAHGTVTVLAGHQPFEVTTLREDVETFGRHATVAFTADWAADARRRDFTINALYCSADGTVHDPLGGWPDLLARRVRFIGDARQRIREDFLRILRFFRFHAEYAHGPLDQAGLHAAVLERHGLVKLSGERLRQEFVKLLVAPGAVAAVDTMTAYGLLTQVLPVAPRLGVFSQLCAREAEANVPASAPLRLAALAIAVDEDVPRLTEKLRLSNDERATLRRSLLHHALADVATAKTLLYRLGPSAYREAVLLAWTYAPEPVETSVWRHWLALPEQWTPPRLPVDGDDVKRRGIPSGPQVGVALKRLEAAWIESGFTMTRDQLLARLERDGG